MQKITQEQLENWFTYHKPSEDQLPKYQKIRESAKSLAQTIVDACPASADTIAALRLLREAVMTANQSIACDDSPTFAPRAQSA